MASKPNERLHSCGDHLYCVPRKRHQFKLLGPLVLEPRGRLSMCGAFLITPSRRKTDFGVDFVYAQLGYTLPTRTKKTLVEHKPGSLPEDGCQATSLGYRPEGLRATFEVTTQPKGATHFGSALHLDQPE